MASALCLYVDNRIHSAWRVLPNGNYDGMPIVEELPEGDITDYRYSDGAYIYDPLPHSDPEPPVQTPTLEDRVESLESTTDDMILMMAELIGG